MANFSDGTSGVGINNNFDNLKAKAFAQGTWTFPSASEVDVAFSLDGHSGRLVLKGTGLGRADGEFTLGTITSFDLTYAGIHLYSITGVSVAAAVFNLAVSNWDGQGIFDPLYSGNDTFNLTHASAGGSPDTLSGGAGNDTFKFGANFNPNDHIDGGTGTNTISLNGDYGPSRLTFGTAADKNIQIIKLAAGHSYNIGLNASYGQALTLDGSALGSTTKLTASTGLGTYGNFTEIGGSGNDSLTGGDYSDTLRPGMGNDTVYGGAGNDTIDFTNGQLNAADKIDGGTGTDTVYLNSDYTGAHAVTFNATTMVNVEKLTLAAGHSYTLATNDMTVASGKTLTINGSALSASNVLTFNGAAETNGHFVIIGGNGGDKLTGGALSDTFTYTSAAQSTGMHYDTITGFKFGTDIFDIPGGAGAITGINTKVTSGALSTATFDANLTSAISSSHLGAHHAVLFTPTSGTLAGATFLIVDLNGVAGYQSGHDLVIRMNGATGTLAAGGFH